MKYRPSDANVESRLVLVLLEPQLPNRVKKTILSLENADWQMTRTGDTSSGQPSVKFKSDHNK